MTFTENVGFTTLEKQKSKKKGGAKWKRPNVEGDVAKRLVASQVTGQGRALASEQAKKDHPPLEGNGQGASPHVELCEGQSPLSSDAQQLALPTPNKCSKLSKHDQPPPSGN